MKLLVGSMFEIFKKKTAPKKKSNSKGEKRAKHEPKGAWYSQ